MNKKEVVNIWLIGETTSNLSTTTLPLAIDVLKVFFHHQRISKETIENSAKKVAKEIESIWSKTAIPTMLLRNIALKIEGLKIWHDALKKSRFRMTDKQLQKQTEFQESLNKIFDITSQSDFAISKEQQKFLEDQRGPRLLDICSIKPLAAPLILPMEVEVSDTDESSDESEGSDFEDSIPAYYKHNSNLSSAEILKTILNSTDVTSALDRVNISDGKFTIIVSAIARAFGEITQCTLSRSTVSRKRNHNRNIIINDVKQDFYSLLEKASGLVIHFDGKMLNNYTAENREDRDTKVDRIAIVVSGHNIEHTLGVVVSNDGTGASIAEAANRMISEWDTWNETYGKNKNIQIRDRIIGMAFDTTSSNTGHLKGACKKFEEEYMKKRLLHFACRHHVYEVIVGGVFKKLFGKTKAPNVPVFEKFEAKWKEIDKTKFEGLENIHFKKPFAALLRKKTIQFLLQALSSENTYAPRDDYKELMELCLLVLGHPLEGYTFKKPGATHHARWMSKIIYSFKIFLFRNQFNLTEEETNNFEEMCLFGSLVYVKAWVQCPLTSDAPLNDLNFFKLLKKYKVVSETVSEAAIAKFENHLWYVSPELVVLSLFSNNVKPKEKRQIMSNLKKGNDWTARGIRLNDSSSLCNKSLPDLIDCQSMSALESLKLNLDFMYDLDPGKWKDSKDYKTAKAIVDNIKVINDAAERALALMTNYNETLTRKESTKQLVLQVVHDNRKRIKNVNKKTLSTYQMR